MAAYGRFAPAGAGWRTTTRGQAARRNLTVVSASNQQAAAYKKAAAKEFVDKFVKDGQTLGLGSGELSSLCIEEIGRRVMSGELKGVRGVPTSDAAATEAAFHGLPLHPTSSAAAVDLAFEQVDQLDIEKSACIVGVTQEPQQPQLLRALVMAQQRAVKLVVLAEASQVVSRLGGTLPVLIDAETWEQTAEEVDDIVIGDAEVWRRAIPGSPNPTPRGGEHPYVTEDGHNIIDLKYDNGLRLFDEPVAYWQLENELLDIEGVVATGLLLGHAAAAVVASTAGPKVIQLTEDKAAKMIVEDQPASSGGKHSNDRDDRDLSRTAILNSPGRLFTLAQF